MHWVRAVLAMGLASAAFCADEPPGIEVNALSSDGSIEYLESTLMVSDPAGVMVQYGDATVIARQVKLNRETSVVEAEGNVRLQRGAEVWTGETLRYDFASRQIQASDFRTGRSPYFAAGHGLGSDLTNKIHTATNGFVTTDDLAKPGYRVRAKSMTFKPGEYIEARGATLYVGKVPVMYLPRYRRNLNRESNHWDALPGYRSLYGAYLLTTYNWSIATNAAASLHLDYRTKRGVAGGPDVEYDLGRAGHGSVSAYYAHDEDPDVGELGEEIPADRWRVGFSHSAFVHTNLSVKAAVNAESDPYFRHDFFEDEYRKDIMPKSFVEVDRQWSNFSLDLVAQPQINDHLQTVERLPDLKLTGLRQQLGISPFYYESESSLAYLRHREGDFAPATNYAALRGDTYHQLLLPWNFFGWLNVTPRAGGRYTYYGAEHDTLLDQDSQDRWVFNTGAEVSTKMSRLWRNARSRVFDVSGLRHIVEPSVNYVYVPTPNSRPLDLPQFDYEWPGLEMMPIEYPDYNSIDAIDSQNVLRFGLRNRLQTKRRDQVENLLHWALFMDWRLRQRADQETYGDLYSDIDFAPRTWLVLNSELRYDINTTSWRMANHTVTLRPNDVWQWKVGHRYLSEIPGFGPDSGNNLVLSSLHFRLNEDWSFRASQHFEARTGTMQEQYYTVFRDFRSWTGALTLRLRDRTETLRQQEDWTIAFQVSLKAFPRSSTRQSRDDPTYLLGY